MHFTCGNGTHHRLPEDRLLWAASQMAPDGIFMLYTSRLDGGLELVTRF